MNAKNRFKNDVLRIAIQLGAKGHVARKEIESTIEVYEDDEGFNHFGCIVGENTFGGDWSGCLQYWDTSSNNGSIDSTKYIHVVK